MEASAGGEIVVGEPVKFGFPFPGQITRLVPWTPIRSANPSPLTSASKKALGDTVPESTNSPCPLFRNTVPGTPATGLPENNRSSSPSPFTSPIETMPALDGAKDEGEGKLRS